MWVARAARMKTFTSISLVLVVVLCAAGCASEQDDEQSSEAAQTVAACQPDATFHANASRVCGAEGKTPSFGAANRTYHDHGTAKACPGGEAVSIPFSCQ